MAPKLENQKVKILSSEVLDDIYQGLVFGFLAITDDKEQTLAQVGKKDPWHIEALKTITGDEERAHRPLSEILKNDLGLVVDCHINVRGITKGGHVLDTQGFIAHNDDTIVLSYRCTTSIYDWLTNLQGTTSIWEVEDDLEQGFSGCCSGAEGLFLRRRRPRVHTGFYNNFLASLPMIKKHVEPLLRADQPPRKLYVTGYSLGAGLATLATCYFLDFDWNHLPHKFCSVTSGCPRSCGRRMQAMVQGRIKRLDSSKVQVYRLVTENDIVARLPPEIFRYRHIVPPVMIQEGGELFAPLRPIDSDNDKDTLTILKELLKSLQDFLGQEDVPTDNYYERKMSRLPVPIRVHMPPNYLNPVIIAKKKAHESESQLSQYSQMQLKRRMWDRFVNGNAIWLMLLHLLAVRRNSREASCQTPNSAQGSETQDISR